LKRIKVINEYHTMPGLQYNEYMSRLIWITGMPGSGKSTVALKLKEQIPDSVILRMDELRRIVTPQPTYSDEERDYVYRALVFMSKTLCDLGHDVIIDATGNRRVWRRLARELVQDFYEVYLKCSVDLCKEREKTRVDAHGAPKDIYKKGRAGWPVPGVNVPYEEPEHPELIIDAEQESAEEAAEKIMSLLNQ
jgi:adenylylsulfate kinase